MYKLQATVHSSGQRFHAYTLSLHKFCVLFVLSLMFKVEEKSLRKQSVLVFMLVFFFWQDDNDEEYETVSWKCIS